MCVGRGRVAGEAGRGGRLCILSVKYKKNEIIIIFRVSFQFENKCDSKAYQMA